jgi:hypothetical protein
LKQLLAYLRRHRLTTSVFLLGVLIVIVGLLTKTPTVEPEESQTTPTPVNKTVDNSRPEDSAAQVPSEKQAGSPPAVGATNPSQSAEPFSYETEKINVAQLAKQLPQSRQQLLDIAVKADVYKKEKKSVDAHTMDDITQNQMGAIKVMALRALMTQEKDTETIKDDLNYVIQKAQDPTIVKVAKAAKSSLEKGRPFFKDFLDAISGMPL